jgi:hypothetical protein
MPPLAAKTHHERVAPRRSRIPGAVRCGAVTSFSQNKPATSNQPAVLFSQNKPAPAISHQSNEQAVGNRRDHGTPVQRRRPAAAGRFAPSRGVAEQTSSSAQRHMLPLVSRSAPSSSSPPRLSPSVAFPHLRRSRFPVLAPVQSSFFLSPKQSRSG